MGRGAPERHEHLNRDVCNSKVTLEALTLMLMDVSTSRVNSRHSAVSGGWVDVAGDEGGHRRDERTTMRTSISDSGGNQWGISKV